MDNNYLLDKERQKNSTTLLDEPDMVYIKSNLEEIKKRLNEFKTYLQKTKYS